MNNKHQLEQMRNNMLALAKPFAAQEIASLISEGLYQPAARGRNYG